MPKPDSLNLKKENPTEYTIKGQNGRAEAVFPTDTKDGNHLIIIKGSGIDTWGLDGKNFPERPNFGGGSAVAIAVLDKKHELVGVALGRVEGNGITVDRIQFNDGNLEKFGSKITVGVKSEDGHQKIEEAGAEKLSKAVQDAVNKHRDNLIKGHGLSALVPNDMQKYEVASASPTSSPSTPAGNPALIQSKPNLAV